MNPKEAAFDLITDLYVQAREAMAAAQDEHVRAEALAEELRTRVAAEQVDEPAVVHAVFDESTP